MKLSELKSAVPQADLTGDAEITSITFDSRKIAPGCLFAALVGGKLDGHDFVRGAVASGASAVLVERRMEGLSVPQLIADDSREALGKVAAKFYGYPSKDLRVIGVTGTNGKTTSTYLLRSIIEASGSKTGVIGTISYSAGATEVAAVNTTPESLVVQQLLREMKDGGCGWAAMEVSSQALDSGRVDEVVFAAAIFTNLSPEHLDHHLTMDNYARAKSRLFRLLGPEGAAVVNADDDFSPAVLGGRTRNILRFGFGPSADVRVVRLETRVDGSRFTVASPWGEMKLRTPLSGKHNVYNCLGAAAAAGALGIKPDAISAGIAALSLVSGRLERVDEGQPFAVFVDYAHTPEALKCVLKAVRELTKKRVIVVFGCGGNRDRTKRPLMREACEKLADLCVVTSDNPRDEDPQAIIDEVMTGTKKPEKFTVESDRKEAIRRALGMARPGDLVLIAGKGHETYQIFKDGTVHFDDREAAREVLRRTGAR